MDESGAPQNIGYIEFKPVYSKQFRQWPVNDTRLYVRWSTEVIVERATEARENDHERN